MLSKPLHGWSTFNLGGWCRAELSYLDDIAFEWVDQAIHGLETMLPFCVKGFLEPSRFLCLVSYRNCHVIVEPDGNNAFDEMKTSHHVYHIGMMDFCKMLYDDVNANLDDWVSFIGYYEVDFDTKKAQLVEKLKRLKELIDEKEPLFADERTFL